MRVAAAPVNPSDLGAMDGLYPGATRFPFVPGNEGSGTVVAAGSGLFARALLGRRVACAASPPSGGTYAEYLVTRADRCLPLRRDVELEQAATLIVNPLTALGLMEGAKRGGHRAIVNSAAASALGRMVTRLAKREGVDVIAVLRSDEKREMALQEGARYVISSASDDFVSSLREAAQELRATLFLDAVAGEFTGQLLEAAPEGSTVVLYGALSSAALTADPRTILFGDRRVEGFYLPTWLRGKGLLGLARISGRAQRLLGRELSTHVRERVSLEEAPAAVEGYRHAMGSGKVLLVPGA